MYDFRSFINVKVYVKVMAQDVVLVSLPYELEKSVYSALIGWSVQ